MCVIMRKRVGPKAILTPFMSATNLNCFGEMKTLVVRLVNPTDHSLELTAETPIWITVVYMTVGTRTRC